MALWKWPADRMEWRVPVPDDSIPFEEQVTKESVFIEGSYEEIELEEMNEELTAEVIPAVPEVKTLVMHR